MSTIFHIIFSLTMLGFIAGMIKPAWIMRTNANPSRKKIAIVAVPVLLISCYLTMWLRTPEEVAQDKAAAAQKEASEQAQTAQANGNTDTPSVPHDVAVNMCAWAGTYVSGVTNSVAQGEAIDISAEATKLASQSATDVPAQYTRMEEALLVQYGTKILRDPNAFIRLVNAGPEQFRDRFMPRCVSGLSGQP
jgi:hypothetical protein